MPVDQVCDTLSAAPICPDEDFGAWPEAIVAFLERVTSPAGIVERQLAVVPPGADRLLAEGLGTERDQGARSSAAGLGRYRITAIQVQ
jgi:hypothetical protein